MSGRQKVLLLLTGGLLIAAGIAACLLLRSPTLPEPSAALKAASQGLDDIVIEARLNPENGTVSVRQQLKMYNRTGQTLNASILRTWANAFQTLETSPCAAEEALYSQYYPDGFSMGALVLAQARVNGQQVWHRYTDEAKTVLFVPVAAGWQPEQSLLVELEYTLHVPRMAYRFGVQDGIWALGNAFAIPAVWKDGAYRMDAYAPVGDPFVSDCANYTVSVTVPKGYVCAGSGWPTVETAGQESVYRFESLAVRDFALVISDGFASAQDMQNGVLVTAYAAEPKHARELLRDARKALDCYEKRFGDYPYPSYTLASIRFPHGGMEYPALSMISTAYLQKGGRELEYLVAHETAHQWWYAAVGSDGWNQPWQDEALCEFSVLEYAQDVYGAAERADLEQARAHSAMRVTVPQGVTPGAPLSAFGSMGVYSLVVYDRGAACMIALDATLHGGLDAFLRDYYAAYAFGRADRTDFETLLAQSTGEDLSPLLRDYLDTYILN